MFTWLVVTGVLFVIFSIIYALCLILENKKHNVFIVLRNIMFGLTVVLLLDIMACPMM